MKSFDGRTAIVTGAASGIGRATALLLADRGANVLAVDRDDQLLGTLEGRLGRRGRTLLTDVTDIALEEKLKAALASIPAPLSVLINNAGIGGGDRLDRTGVDDLRHMLEINLVSLFRMCQLGVDLMRGKGGAIVNVASIYAEIGATRSAAYSTSKGAVATLTRQIATDFGPEGIRINAVAPGLIETPMTKDRIHTEKWRHEIFVEQSPLRRVGQPEEVASAILFLAGPDAGFISGEVLRVDGGWAVGRYPRPEEAV
ncbi:SDR family NAD(P)-dependent oxidoreductase [Nitratireductor sp.]|uniref:SDR family NAD(P)-dependent oxidoreductase n=1 Tax=Nitratireductor sp. TaxID=1872084 RepID=UPI0025E0F5FD|nr:SDR family oxidoreductase [Nitratireductor sp.]